MLARDKMLQSPRAISAPNIELRQLRYLRFRHEVTQPSHTRNIPKASDCSNKAALLSVDGSHHISDGLENFILTSSPN